MATDNPMVGCIMLVNGRDAMVRRAFYAFLAQSYPRKALYIWDTTPGRGVLPVEVYNAAEMKAETIYYPDVDKEHFRGQTIGVLRNAANKYALAHYTTSDTKPDVLMHWDSDDWSHPYRIEEQVQLLVASGKECVGYNSLLFWREAQIARHPSQMSAAALDAGSAEEITPGAAWLYSNVRHDYAVGTSLCYWADVWRRLPFQDLPKRAGGTGEDSEWIKGVRCGGVPSFNVKIYEGNDGVAPRMIASIHGGNTQLYASDMMNLPNWQRVPEWDQHCAGVMAL